MNLPSPINTHDANNGKIRETEGAASDNKNDEVKNDEVENAPGTPGSPDQFAQRQARIEEYSHSSRHCKDPLKSIVGGAVTDLARMQLQVNSAVVGAVGTGPMTFDEFNRNYQGLEMLTKLSKAAIQAAKVYHQLPDAPATREGSEAKKSKIDPH